MFTRLFLQVDGRIGRRAWWLGALSLTALRAGAGFLALLLIPDRGVVLPLVQSHLLVELLLAWPSFALAVKRQHDMNAMARGLWSAILARIALYFAALEYASGLIPNLIVLGGAAVILTIWVAILGFAPARQTTRFDGDFLTVPPSAAEAVAPAGVTVRDITPVAPVLRALEAVRSLCHAAVIIGAAAWVGIVGLTLGISALIAFAATTGYAVALNTLRGGRAMIAFAILITPAVILAIAGAYGMAMLFLPETANYGDTAFLAGLPLCVAGIYLFIRWLRIVGLPADVRRIASPWPPVKSWDDVWREIFGVWPGFKRSRSSLIASTTLLYLSSIFSLIGFFMLVILPGLFWIVFVPMVVTTADDAELWQYLYIGMGGALAAFVFSMILARLFQLGAQSVSRQTLEQQVSHDERPHILFLRSFENDQVSVPVRAWTAQLSRLGLARPRLDYLLVEAFSRYGPILALGKPGEKSLPFGAARTYVEHDRWQQVVTDLAANSIAVVLVADDSPGVAWEIDTLLAGVAQKPSLVLRAPAMNSLSDNTRVSAWLATRGVKTVETPLHALVLRPNGDIALIYESARASIESYRAAMQLFFRDEVAPSA